MSGFEFFSILLQNILNKNEFFRHNNYHRFQSIQEKVQFYLVNTVVCEQFNFGLGGFKYMVKHINYHRFHFFLFIMFIF